MDIKFENHIKLSGGRKEYDRLVGTKEDPKAMKKATRRREHLFGQIEATKRIYDGSDTDHDICLPGVKDNRDYGVADELITLNRKVV